MKRALVCGVVMAAAGWGLVVQASPLTFSGGKDLAVFDLSINYDYTSSNHSGIFTATGTVIAGDNWKLYSSGTHASKLDSYATGTFNLTANFTVTGATTYTINSGSLSILGPSSTVLFSASSLQKFGFTVDTDNTGVDQWQFLFATGKGPSGAVGAIGVKLNGGSTTTYKSGADKNKNYDDVAVNLMEDFQDLPNAGAADTMDIVPLPRAAYMSLGAPALLLLLRRRGRFQAS